MKFPDKDDVLYNSYDGEEIEAWVMKNFNTIVILKKEMSRENLLKLVAIVKALI